MQVSHLLQLVTKQLHYFYANQANKFNLSETYLYQAKALPSKSKESFIKQRNHLNINEIIM